MKVNIEKDITNIKIEESDVWDMDCTLALIIVPMLETFRKQVVDAPHIKDEDVPDSIKSINATVLEEQDDLDEFHVTRWLWVLDEMIWSFKEIIEDNWLELSDAELEDRDKRISKGTMLFGKYYRNLWG